MAEASEHAERAAKAEQLRPEIRSWLEAAMKEIRGERSGKARVSEEEEFAERRKYADLLARDGWSALTWDEKWGGRGLSLREQLVFAGEAARVDAPDALSRLGTDIIGPALMALGSSEHQERHLPRIRAAEEIWCLGISEPGAGSDLAALRTKAVETDSGGWRINGQKIWTSFGQYADYCFVLARTEPDAPAHKGISAFAVPLDTPGVSIVPIDQITGGSDFCETFFDDVEVPADALISERGGGWKFAMTSLGFERSINFMTRQVRLSSQVAEVIERVRARADRVPGRLKDELVEIYTRSLALRATVGHHIESLDRGEPPGPDSSCSKIYWSEMFQKLAGLGAELEQVVPGFRDPEKTDWAHTYVLARAATIYAGTSEIQRTIIAERGLGLPR